MIACVSCGTTNPEGFRFCGQCGAALVVDGCQTCGASNPLGQRFCGQCGTALAGDRPGTPSPLAAAPLQEERKLATIVFADVVGFTSLAERTDHEVVARTVDASFRRLAEIVAEHGGVVDKYMGDSVMAVFGVPQAHDDDAERAVAAALAMRELGGDLSFSIGVNSGEVMVAALGPEGGVTVIGDAVNVAARLEKAAGPGEVLVGPLTAELAGRRVVLRERGPVLVKGKSEPLPVYEAVALRDQPGDRPGETTPLVGRDGELGFLLAQWRRVRDDRRASVVVVTGDGGIGKSRLVGELAAAVSTLDEGRVVRAAYPGYGGLGGMRLAAELFTQLGTTGDAQIDTRVRSVAGELHPSLVGIDPGALQQEQLWAVRRLFEEKTAAQPLLVILDDLHRAAARTVETLVELAQRVAELPVLLVLVGRSDPAEWLAPFSAATTVRLAALARSDAAMLARAYVGGVALGDDAGPFLVERSGGNPLYLRELVTVLRDRGGLVRDHDGTLQLARELPVPATLQAVLAARLDALAPAQKLVLQHVAVLGVAATAEQVAALGGAPDAADVLRALCDAGLLRRSTGGAYDVVDPLLREVAYESLPRSVRGERHRASAATSNRVDRARHLGRAAAYLPDDATLAAEAVAALKDGAADLRAASRPVEAGRLLERAVELAPDDVDATLALAKTRLELNLAVDVVEPLLSGLPPLDDPAQAAQRDHLLGASRMFSDPVFAADALQDVAQRWHALDRFVDEGWAWANAGVALFNQSRMEASLQALERAIEPFRAAGDRGGEMAVYSFLSLVRPNDPRVPKWLDESLAWADERGDQQRLLSTLLSLGWFHFFRQRFGSPQEMAEVLAYTERGAALAGDLGNAVIGAHMRCLRSNLLRSTGRIDEAAAMIEPCDDAPLRGKSEEVLLRAARNVLTLARDPDAPVDRFGPTNEPTARAAAAMQAESLALAGRFDEAMAQFDAVDPDGVFGVGGALRSTRLIESLARVLAGRDPSPTLIDEIRRGAVAEGVAPVRLAAEALLAELSGDRAALAALPADPPAGLAGALVLRARATSGDEAAAAELVRRADELRAPGLAGGIRAPS